MSTTVPAWMLTNDTATVGGPLIGSSHDAIIPTRHVVWGARGAVIGAALGAGVGALAGGVLSSVSASVGAKYGAIAGAILGGAAGVYDSGTT